MDVNLAIFKNRTMGAFETWCKKMLKVSWTDKIIIKHMKNKKFNGTSIKKIKSFDN